MYGTAMIATLKGDRDAMERELADWVATRGPEVSGFVDARLLFGEDGKTVVNTVRFESREDYVRLADDPRQDTWYAEHVAPLIEGDAQWIDGYWIESSPG
jgi:hypothetical protein